MSVFSVVQLHADSSQPAPSSSCHLLPTSCKCGTPHSLLSSPSTPGLNDTHRNTRSDAIAGAIELVLGEDAPQYEEGQCPLAFLQELVQWGSRPGASLDGWVQLHENTPVVDLGVLHRAECFPHRWPVPLTAAGVVAANQRAAAGDPAALLQEAVAACAPRRRQQFGGGIVDGGSAAAAAAVCAPTDARNGAASRRALSGSLKRKQPSPAVPVAAAALPPPPPPPQQQQQQQNPPPLPPPPPPQQQLQQQQLQGDALLLEQLGVLKPLLEQLRMAAGLDLVTASSYRSIFLHRMSPIVRGEEVDILEELVAGGQLAAAAAQVRATVA